tara:strand:+ start:443 stop:1366 length:924 start_codon:yes stop_codon:yes gene_type:complete
MASEIKVDTIVNAGGDNDSGIDLSTNDIVAVKTANTERMRVDASGRVGIGITPDTTSNGKSLQINRSVINDDDGGSTHIAQNGYYNSAWKYVEDGTAEKISFVTGTIRFDNASSNSSGADASLSWSERMRIDSSGNVLIGTTTTSAATEPGVILKPDGGLHMNNSTTGGGISLILLYSSHSTTDQTKFEVTSEGNVKSRTNSYAGFSDERLKEQIVDASSQWDDIKAIEIKNFKFISNLDDADNPKMLGVIAQQVEKVSPNLVEVDPKDDMKTVKYSLLYLKAVKALQEAMARIETLEAKVKELESK